VNPHYVELVKKRDELERKIFEKKHQQQIFKQMLIFGGDPFDESKRN
jgi:hypothetical protein